MRGQWRIGGFSDVGRRVGDVRRMVVGLVRSYCGKGRGSWVKSEVGVRIVGKVVVVGGSRGGRRKVVGIISIGVDGLVGGPFGEEVGVLEERLALLMGKGFDAGDGGVGEHDLGPVTGRFGDDITSDKRHEPVAVVLVAGGAEGDGAEGAGTGGVGGAVGEHHVGAEFEFKRVVIGGGGDR